MTDLDDPRRSMWTHPTTGLLMPHPHVRGRPDISAVECWCGRVPKHPLHTTYRSPAARPHVTGWTLAWAGWIVLFLGLEVTALLHKEREDTFSEFWWRLFRVRARVPVPVRILLAVVQLAFATWLAGHLAFGWWTL